MRILTRLTCLIIVGIFWSGCADTPAPKKSGSFSGGKIQDGRDINRPDPNGFTPLMRAAAKNQASAVERLLKAGADIHDRTPDGFTAIDLAYSARAFEAFQLLLEKGAVSSLDPEFGKSLPKSDSKKRFFDLLRELPCYKELQTATRIEDITRFDRYFSLFPKGVYRHDAEALFYAFLNNLTQFLEEKSNKKDAEHLADSLRKMGTRLYRVAASALNIRKNGRLNAQLIGKYRKGDIVYGERVQEKWIRTSDGWVSRRHLRKMETEIPRIDIYLERLETLRAAPIAGKKTIRQKGALNTSPRKRDAKPSSDPYSTDLEGYLKNEDKSGLEKFILKHRDDPEASDAVRRAKEAYKKILLSD